MASATSTTFFSYWLTWRSTSEAKVAGGAGAACACGAGVAAGVDGVVPPCANAPTAKASMANRQKVLICFIVKLSRYSILSDEKDTTLRANHKGHPFDSPFASSGSLRAGMRSTEAGELKLIPTAFVFLCGLCG